MNTLLNLIFFLVLIGLIWWLVRMIPMPAPMMQIIDVVFVILAVLVVLGVMGVGGINMGSWNVLRLR